MNVTVVLGGSVTISNSVSLVEIIIQYLITHKYTYNRSCIHSIKLQ